MESREKKLKHYIDAQKSARHKVTLEIEKGKKETHWMWYIFPQVEGLGGSRQANYYAIKSLSQARDYLSHPDLGPQLREWVELVLKHENLSADEIFGDIDAMKFRSSMTLFSEIDTIQNSPFSRVINNFYGGNPCPKTKDWLQRQC